MRSYLTITGLIFLAACTYDPNNGEHSLHPELLSRPIWEISEQSANGPVRFCSVSAGNLQVALKTDGHDVRQQVAPTYEIHPGDTFSAHIGSHKYETTQDWFSADDSQKMIQDFLGSQGNIYTELYKVNAANHDMEHNNQSDKIPLAGFAALYQSCKNYLQMPN